MTTQIVGYRGRTGYMGRTGYVPQYTAGHPHHSAGHHHHSAGQHPALRFAAGVDAPTVASIQAQIAAVNKIIQTMGPNSPVGMAQIGMLTLLHNQLALAQAAQATGQPAPTLAQTNAIATNPNPDPALVPVLQQAAQNLSAQMQAHALATGVQAAAPGSMQAAQAVAAALNPPLPPPPPVSDATAAALAVATAPPGMTPVLSTDAIPTAIIPAQPAQQAPLGRLPYGGSPAVEEQQPRNVRQYPLGFTQLAVPAAQTAIVTSRPQVLFRGYRLIVPTSGGAGPAPASPAVNFVIVDIRVGKNSQLVQASELPASIFQETSFDIALTMDTAQISQDIAITVRNTDAVNARDFRAVLIGAALE